MLTSAYRYENHRVPFHGIPYPQYENPVNLFQRQLQIEQYSFETSHQRYKKQVIDLIKIGRADQLSASHRNILKWTKTLEAAISEQQRIFMKQGSLDTNKIGFYVVSMPSDELASICVIHMMRHLLGEFLNNTNKDAERYS